MLSNSILGLILKIVKYSVSNTLVHGVLRREPNKFKCHLKDIFLLRMTIACFMALKEHFYLYFIKKITTLLYVYVLTLKKKNIGTLILY